MIVDTSVLIAIIFGEDGVATLTDAIVDTRPFIPAPVITELYLVAQRGGKGKLSDAEELVESLAVGGAEFVPFDHRHAAITATARALYGKGNGTGGLLNFGDLMVYAVAKASGFPLLCAGRDFASTDLVLHPASRIDP